MESRSPTLQVDSLLSEPPGKPGHGCDIFLHFSKDTSPNTFCWFVLTFAWTMSCLASLFPVLFRAFICSLGPWLPAYIKHVNLNPMKGFQCVGWMGLVCFNPHWRVIKLIMFGKSLLFSPVSMSFEADQMPERQSGEITQLDANVLRAKWLKGAADYWLQYMNIQLIFIFSKVSYCQLYLISLVQRPFASHSLQNKC